MFLWKRENETLINIALFSFQKSYWCGGTKIHDGDVEMDTPPGGEFFEEPPTNVKPGIRIRNLKKV